jgi:hypothetical protein
MLFTRSRTLHLSTTLCAALLSACEAPDPDTDADQEALRDAMATLQEAASRTTVNGALESAATRTRQLTDAVERHPDGGLTCDGEPANEVDVDELAASIDDDPEGLMAFCRWIDGPVCCGQVFDDWRLCCVYCIGGQSCDSACF